METPYLAKADIKDVFRLLPVAPACHNLLDFKFQGLYYFDKCLPMGCAASCNIFEKFSDALVYVLKHTYKVKHIVKVLDDFLFLGDSKKECQHALDSFLQLADLIALPLAQHKTVQPTQCLVFLGIELDTKNRIARLPQDKITKYVRTIKEATNAVSLTLREVKSLIGKLQFATSTIRGGRCFLRRLHDLTIGRSSPFHKLVLSADAKDDLLLWESFLTNFNGVEITLPTSHFAHSICTDASLTGYGGTYRNNYIQGCFPQSWSRHPIHVLELFPIYLLINITGGFSQCLATDTV